MVAMVVTVLLLLEVMVVVVVLVKNGVDGNCVDECGW